jgi:hypothetical protein
MNPSLHLLPPVAQGAQQLRNQAAADAWPNAVRFRDTPGRRAGKVAERAAYERGEAAPVRGATATAVAADGRFEGFGGYQQALGWNDLTPEQRLMAAKGNFIQAPLGGHVRNWAAQQGQDWINHRGGQTAEQVAAGVLATGVGSWGLLSAIDALNGDSQTPGTMPMV